MTELETWRLREADAPAPAAVVAFAEALAGRRDAAAVLFYGSVLRSGDLSGVLDVYVLTAGPHRAGLRGWIERRLWPEIGFERWDAPPVGGWDGGVLHAKVATLPLNVFLRAAEGRSLDTTVWTRFVQPCRLVHARDGAAREAVGRALAAAAVTAARFAAVLGPERGTADAFWGALFRQTYAAELRVEPPGRERQVLAADPDRYAALLPLAWSAGGVAHAREGETFVPRPPPRERARWLRAWRRRRRAGKPLNLLRLLKAAITSPGAARYAADKLGRHTGLGMELTPWRERHPVLAGLLVLWRLRRR